VGAFLEPVEKAPEPVLTVSKSEAYTTTVSKE
jgi:hypothetical protein